MKAKGTILLIGGAEDKSDHPPEIASKHMYFKRFEILKELLKISRNRSVEVITTGSRFQNEVKTVYQRVFKKLGYPHVGFMPIQNKAEAKNEKYLARIEKAGTVFFTGGDQFRITNIMGGTQLVEIIRKKYQKEKNFLIAGTSAGAMVLSDIAIIAGGIQESLIDNDLQTSSGLFFLEKCIVDTHFIKRGRFARLAHAIILNQEHIGIGLCENTALIIKGGIAECRGTGMVVIIDGKNIEQTNISKIERGEREPIFVENLNVSMLIKNCRFSFKTRRVHEPLRKRTHKKRKKNHD